MQVDQDSPLFRPVTIRIETQDEFDQLFAIVAAVAENCIHHAPQTIRAAVDIRQALTNVECI